MTRRYPPGHYNKTDPTRGAYNGFSLADRFVAADWAKTRTDVRPLKPTPEMRCIICDQHGTLRWHQEDYRKPLDAFPICDWCHWALHSRLKPEQRWLWPLWTKRIARGWRPPPVPAGTRWATFQRLFLRTPMEDWPHGPEFHGYYRHPIVDLLAIAYIPRVPTGLDLVAGDPHLPGQFVSNCPDLAPIPVEHRHAPRPVRPVD